MIWLILIFILLLIHYLIFLVGIGKGINKVSHSSTHFKNSEFISVIIPFRNERENLLESLNSITAQNFPQNQFEVIYIDDNSDDNSYEILEENIQQKNVKIFRSEFDLEDRAHKKLALDFAIKKSKGEIIITTDADCIHDSDWLKTMAAQFDENTAFVSGPVEFKSNGSLFEELQKLEFSSLILVGSGLIGINNPIICNAANLGFRKSVFFEVGGYDDNMKLSSGDDEFLMQKISRETDYEVKFCFEKKAISFSKPNKNLNQFYHQRKRWASKGFYYVDKKIVIKLIFIFLFYLGIPIQLMLGIFFRQEFLVSLVISFILKTIFEFWIVQTKSKKLFSKTKNYIFLLAEFLHVPYILIAGISGIFGNYKWKGRDIKR